MVILSVIDSCPISGDWLPWVMGVSGNGLYLQWRQKWCWEPADLALGFRAARFSDPNSNDDISHELLETGERPSKLRFQQGVFEFQQDFVWSCSAADWKIDENGWKEQKINVPNSRIVKYPGHAKTNPFPVPQVTICNAFKVLSYTLPIQKMDLWNMATKH